MVSTRRAFIRHPVPPGWVGPITRPGFVDSVMFVVPSTGPSGSAARFRGVAIGEKRVFTAASPIRNLMDPGKSRPRPGKSAELA
jgi:hypothetical protein